MESLVEKCGVTGIWSSQRSYPAARMAHAAQLYLGHRGQDAHGLASWDSEIRGPEKQKGRVTHDFSSSQYDQLSGSTAIGHNRYRTAGAMEIEYVQPIREQHFALAHNGTIYNARELALELMDGGVSFLTGRRDGRVQAEYVSDTEVLAALIAQKSDIVEGIKYASTRVRGAYSLTILDDKGNLYGVRDPRGMKPLCKTRSNNAVGIFSESCVLESPLLRADGMEWDGDIPRGSIYRIGQDGEEIIPLPEKAPRAFDIFEYVYFADPTSEIDGISVSLFRMYGGHALAKREHVHGIPAATSVPHSGDSWTRGYVEALGLKQAEWLMRSRSGDRVFIGATSLERQEIASSKFLINPAEIRRFPSAYLVDDSIVRGDTMKNVIQRLRKAGAREIHLRSGYPEVLDTCPWGGINMHTRGEQLANQIPDLGQRRDYLGVDSLLYTQVSDLEWAANEARSSGTPVVTLNDFCTHCITHKNPFD